MGEMFYNFPLHTILKSVSGADLTQFRDLLEKHFPECAPFPNRIIYHWCRTWMGLKPSPYRAARFFYFMEEYILGDHTELTNHFRWDKIILNLPGSKQFNPTLPFVIKWDAERTLIAAAIKAYVDDLRVIAATRELAWQAGRQVAARVQYLGSQDASRKRRLDNGPWAGTVFNVANYIISKTVTAANKRLEQIRGYLCHLAMTFDIFFAYLKGFHLTLSQHLPERTDQGWKISDLEWIGYVEERFQTDKISSQEKDRLLSKLPGSDIPPPKFVLPVPRFYQCLNALLLFFEPDIPPCVHM